LKYQNYKLKGCYY